VSRKPGAVQVFLCDTFRGVVHAGASDTAYVGGEHADTSVSTVSSLAARLGLVNIRILQGVFPAEAADRIAAQHIRLCHMDVDVYESARQSFEWVWPRIVTGGIVVLDDYGFYSCGGVTKLVNTMIGLSDRLVIYNINGHAIIVKRGEIGTHTPQPSHGIAV